MKGFYVMCDAGGTGKSTTIRRACKVFGVGTAVLNTVNPALYDGIAVDGRTVGGALAAGRIADEHARGRLTIVATNDAALADRLVALGAARKTPAEIGAMLDGVAP